MDIVERLRSVTRLLRETEETSYEQDDTLASEAADEIERLRDQIFQFKNATPQILSSHNETLKNYVNNTELILQEIREENERLREALKDIGAECFVPHGTDKEMWVGWRAVAVERVDVARAALKGD